MLPVLLRKDVSISRRVFQWLLNQTTHLTLQHVSKMSTSQMSFENVDLDYSQCNQTDDDMERDDEINKEEKQEMMEENDHLNDDIQSISKEQTPNEFVMKLLIRVFGLYLSEKQPTNFLTKTSFPTPGVGIFKDYIQMNLTHTFKFFEKPHQTC